MITRAKTTSEITALLHSIDRQCAKAKKTKVAVFASVAAIVLATVSAVIYAVIPEYVVHGTVFVNEKRATVGFIGISGSSKSFKLTKDFPGHFELRGLSRKQTTVNVSVNLTEPFEIIKHDVPVEIIDGKLVLNLETDLGKILDLEPDIADPLASHLRDNKLLSPLTPYKKGDNLTLRLKLDKPTSGRGFIWSKGTDIENRRYTTVFSFIGDVDGLSEDTTYTITCKFDGAELIGPQKIQVNFTQCYVIP